jgi:hypothetical protein
MTHINTEFPYRLGPTNPCPIAVHMEPSLDHLSMHSRGDRLYLRCHSLRDTH